MSIPHIEDLDPLEFLHVIQNLGRMRATEKLDGSNMIVGCDDNGYLYTSREAKGHAKRCFLTHDWSLNAYDNAFRNAHAAVYLLQTYFYQYLQPGDQLEVEVLFGQQPNTILYGDSRIVLLKTLKGNPERTNKLFRRLMLEYPIRTFAPIIVCELGTIQTRMVWGTTTWYFDRVPELKQPIYTSEEIDLEIKDFEKRVNEHPSGTFDNKKQMRMFFAPHQHTIKELLLNQTVRFHKPVFQISQTDDPATFGIEGIVLLEPSTGKQYKIVDKSTFTLINQFNHLVRNQIKRTSNFDIHKHHSSFLTFYAGGAPYTQLSLYDDMLTKIANVLGVSNLNKYLQLTRNIKRFHTVDSFLSSWQCQNIEKIQKRVHIIVEDAMNNLVSAFDYFTNNHSTFNLVLKDGRTIRYSTEIVERTKLVFATVHQELVQMRNNIDKSVTLKDLAKAIYGKSFDALT